MWATIYVQLGLGRVTKQFSQTFGWLCILALSMIVLACSAETEPTVQSQDSGSATFEPEPTFVRVTATPAPIDTPTPAAIPTVPSVSTAEQLADPVFPDWLDPELTDVRPSDEKIIQGWTDFLSDTVITNQLFGNSQEHFCADGTHFSRAWPSLELVESPEDWSVTLHPGLSSSDWGTVQIQSIPISRIGGKLWGGQQEHEIRRSLKCLELAATSGP